MKKRNQISNRIEESIVIVRAQRVMLDSDLARIYGIPTFRLNEAVKRNHNRFPKDFMYQLTGKELSDLKSQIAISSLSHGGRRSLPYVFTEHGAIMVANILKSKRAVKMSIFVVRAFIRMRSFLNDRRDLALELQKLEKKLTGRLDAHELAIVDVLRRLMTLLEPSPELSEPEKPKRQIGFHP